MASTDSDDAMRERLLAAIKEIADDNRAGAAEILRRAAQVYSLLRDSQAESIADEEKTRALIIRVSAELMQAQPLMSPLANLASAVVTAAMNSTGAQEIIESATSTARDFADNAEQSISVVSQFAAELIFDGAIVLMHSRSSTVLAALMNARRAGKIFSVIATESRPVMEGREIARSLAGEGIAVTLVADMTAALMMKQAHIALVGADKITPEFLVNKIGTRMIALAARELGVPIHALCDSSKFTACSDDVIEKERSTDELWPGAPALVKVSNLYFEPVPLACFSSIITEDGALSPEEAARRAASNKLHPALLEAMKRSRALR